MTQMKTMKIALLFILVIISFTAYSQNTVKIRQVDSLVKLINSSNFKIQRDSLKQEHPEYGYSGRTYLTMITDGNELKKYVNSVHATTVNNGTTKKMDAENSFYFDHNKLIKVEEFAMEGDKKFDVQWYYADDRPLYNTLKSDKGQDRADFLLTMSKSFIETFKKHTVAPVTN